MTEELEQDEQTIFEIQPTFKAQMFWIIIGGICLFSILLSPIGLIIYLTIWVKTKLEKHAITSERVLISHGIIARRIEEVELFRIKDVAVKQSFLDRIFKTGSVKIMSVDESTPAIYISAIDNLIEVKEKLRSLYRTARKKERVVNTELIYNA